MRIALKVTAAVAAVGALTAAAVYGLPAYSEWSRVRAYKARLAFTLRDPTSAQFAALKLVDNPGRSALCGNVNAKNAFGGYAGFRSFIVTDSEVLMQPESEANAVPNGEETIARLQKQIDYLHAMKRHCYHEADVAAVDFPAK